MNLKYFYFLVAFLSCFLTLSVAGERTIPVDIILMIDKSLSMAEDNKFDSLNLWVTDYLIEKTIIEGDRILIFQFYEKVEKILDISILTKDDVLKIKKAVATIKPDGAYTDIGLALDTIKDAVEPLKANGRYTIPLLLTDLKQEAPWTSRYAGVQDKYSNPYLTEARIIQHDKWYEITLDMDIADDVKEKTQLLYAILNNEDFLFEKQEQTTNFENQFNNYDSTDQSASLPASDTEHRLSLTEDQNKTKRVSGLPSFPLFMILSIIVLLLCLVGLIIIVNSRKQKEEQKKHLEH